MSSIDLESIPGLSSAEAQRRLGKEGPNELPSSRRRGVTGIIVGVLHEPMFLLLIASGLIYFVLGDVEEAAALMSFVFVVIGITVYQEHKTENALQALKDLSSPRALVIRDGQRKRVPGREVVTEDTIILSEGDRVPADALLLASNNLLVDESLLTGESVPVRKTVWKEGTPISRPGGDDQPLVYAGTLVVQGQAVAKIMATGIGTEMGKIGKVLQTVERDETELNKDVDRLVRNAALVGAGLFILVVTVYGLTRVDWIQGLLSGITLAMAILPEEFPVVLTVFLALGAWRMSRQNVLTRHTPAIEALGAATVLCVDKTGTLTQNRMSVNRLVADGQAYDYGENSSPPSSAFHQLMEYSILASKKDPFDPMEKALHQLSEAKLAGTEHVHKDWELIQEYPLSQRLLAMSNVWRSRDGTEYVVASKGAPEAIADLCHLDEERIRLLSSQIDTMAAEGLRVLGVAKASFMRPELPEEPHDFSYTFLGLIGFADPVRPGVADAVQECYAAGLDIVMITGDYPLTGQSIARQIGLRSGDCITGIELDKMDDDELVRRIEDVNIFARVVPEQKLRIVNALKANGEIVAMTGDGVNDAPALKSADIGIAMGGRGTDVAREASSLVLLDDDFASIVGAVRMGRRIYDNLKKAVAYIFAVHVPIAGMSLIPVLFGLPLVLAPVHVVFLELIIDPACSIAFEAEAEEADVMKRPPRSMRQRLLNRRMAVFPLLQGSVVLFIVVAVFMNALLRGLSDTQARTMAFVSIVMANLALILTNRSWSQSISSTLRAPNRALWWVFGGALLALGLVLVVPFLRELFRLGGLQPVDFAICLGASILSIAWFEAYKTWKGHDAGKKEK
jgi:Ca2+-transporting ATPase